MIYPTLAEIRKIQWSVNEILETQVLNAIEKVEKKSKRVPQLLEESANSEISHFIEFIQPVRNLLKQVSSMETETLTKLGSAL